MSDAAEASLIERRLVELAQCHCRGGEAEMSLELLAARIGSAASLRSLKLRLKTIAAYDTLPAYEIEVRSDAHRSLRRQGSRQNLARTACTIMLRPRARPIIEGPRSIT